MLNKIFHKIANASLKRICDLIEHDTLLFRKIHHRKDLKHIGTEYGGWIIPVNLINSDSICYCVGCGEDISFDLGLIEFFGCNVFAFDPTPRSVSYVKKVAGDIKKYNFFDLGIFEKEDMLDFYVPRNQEHVSHSILNLQKTDQFIRVKVKRLSSIMQENGHSKIDLLKIDIEGAEYKVINSILEDRLDVKVLCVEYDECFNPIDKNYKNRIKSSVDDLVKYGYKLVCSQGNGNYTFVKAN